MEIPIKEITVWGTSEQRNVLDGWKCIGMENNYNNNTKKTKKKKKNNQFQLKQT